MSINVKHQPRQALVALSENMTSTSALWQSRKIHTIDQGAFADGNGFDALPTEIILDCIGSYLTPQEALSLRKVNKRFAVLFGDNHIWRAYYRVIGLEPIQAPNLMKQYSFWSGLQKSILETITIKEGNFGDTDSTFCGSLCITALAIPELSPLHGFARKILNEYNGIPSELSLKEIMVHVAKDNEDFDVTVTTGVRTLAVQFLSGLAEEPKVRKTLLSVIKHIIFDYEKIICQEAVKGLLPHISDLKVQEVVLSYLERCGPFGVKSALEHLITNPMLLQVVIDEFSHERSGLDEIVRPHLSNPLIVKSLLQRLSEEENPHLVKLILIALRPVFDQEMVQRAICEKSCDDRFSYFQCFLDEIRLVDAVKKEYLDRVPLLQQQAKADELLRHTSTNPAEHRDKLLDVLFHGNATERKVAAVILMPLVPLDSVILDSFFKKIGTKNQREEHFTIISALAKLAHRREIRIALIQSIDPSFDSLSFIPIIQTLRPFADEPEVRQAFLDWLRPAWNMNVRCALLDILASQLDQQDMRSIFLEAAKGVLWNGFWENNESQVAAIDKLGPYTNLPEVLTVLQEIFGNSHGSIKAACIRALCLNPHKRLLDPAEVFTACIDRSRIVRDEAMRALKTWINCF